MSVYDYLFKIVILGDSAVGKSCMVEKFLNNKFLNSHNITIGVDFATKIINLNNKKIKLQIWDTAGQEQYRSIVSSYYRNTSGAIICYDSSCRKSFENVTMWLKQLKEMCENPKILLIATKSDLKKVVNPSEGEKFAKDNNMDFLEVSSKDGKNIDKAFNTLVSNIYSDFINKTNNKEVNKNIYLDTHKFDKEISKEPEITSDSKLCCRIL